MLQSVTATQTSRNIYFRGRLIQSNGSSVATDRVGSVRATEGGLVSEYYPYGEEISHTADGREKFGTYTRESSSGLAGLDYANQRYYSSVYGRFTSADRYQASEGPADPGSWNRYSYTRGDPVNRLDPRGLWDCGADGTQFCIDSGDAGGAGGDCGPGWITDASLWGPCGGAGAVPLPVVDSGRNNIVPSSGPVAVPPVVPSTGIGVLNSVITGIVGAVLRVETVAVGIIASPVSTGGTGPSGTPWGDTYRTVQQVQQYCTPVGEPVVVPSTNTKNPGGTSIEQLYICPDGSYWTIHTLRRRGGGIFEPPHIRPGLPKYGQ